MVTINGRLRLRRTRWHDPELGSETLTDAWLDEAENTISEGVREMACRLNQNASGFAATADNLARAAHIELSKETLRQVVEGEAKAVQRMMQRAELGPTWSAADCKTQQGATRIYGGCDGVLVPLVTGQEKQKRRVNVKAKRKRRGRRCKPLPRLKPGADNAYKEFKVGYLYDEAKEHRLVGVTAANHEVAGRMLKRMSDQIQMPQAQERVALIDGAPWIRNQFELHGLVQAIGLDFYHLQEHVQTARKGVFGEASEEGKRWLSDIMQALKHEGYDAAWQQITELRRSLRSAPKRKALDELLQYMGARRDMIRYPEFQRKCWQIGSGPTEAECKTTTHRVKGLGRRWNADNAEGLMSLAALHDSGLWHRRWITLEPSSN